MNNPLTIEQMAETIFFSFPAIPPRKLLSPDETAAEKADNPVLWQNCLQAAKAIDEAMRAKEAENAQMS